MGDYSLNASKDIGAELGDLAVACGSEPVVGSARTARVLGAGSVREDRSSGVCYVGDTR